MAGVCLEEEGITAGYREHGWIQGAQHQGAIGVLSNDLVTAAQSSKRDTLKIIDSMPPVDSMPAH